MAAKSNLDLAKMFTAVSKTMVQNQAALNKADTHNHDHGDHMVEIFNLATKAMQEKRNASPADQLAYAGDQVKSKMKSGSSQLYAEGFMRASKQFKGQQNLTADNVMTLIQALMGSSQSAQSVPSPEYFEPHPSAQSAQSFPPAQQASQTPPDPLTAILGSLGSSLAGPAAQGQPQASQGTDGLDAGDLISAGLAFLQSQQRGDSTMESILHALLAGSQMSASPDREQSAQLVANTLMQVVGAMAQK